MSRSHLRSAEPLRAVIIAFFCALTMGGRGQDDDAGAGHPREQDQTPAPADAPTDAEPRLHLLREGTRLVEARGEVVREAERDRVLFRAPATASNGEPAVTELTLLPSTRLEEIDRLMQSMERQRMPFELTGRVYLYLGRNYLLVQQAVQSRDTPAAAAPMPDEQDAVDDEPDAPEDDSAAARRRETDRIIADLERSLGNLPPPQRDASPPPVAAASGELPYREGEMIVHRRGRPVMTAEGQWRLVFDADATGFADPPMLLMPCRLLERLQRIGQRDPADRAVRITGEVHIYRGQPYLLPLSYHEATDRSRLSG